jgi:hypothetical protein
MDTNDTQPVLKKKVGLLLPGFFIVLIHAPNQH